MATTPTHSAPHAETKETAHPTVSGAHGTSSVSGAHGAPTRETDAEAGTEAERKTAGERKADERRISDDRTAADRKAADKPVNHLLLLAMLATDWVVGDKHHYAIIRQMVSRLLTEIGDDGIEAGMRLEGIATPGDAERMVEDIATLQAVLDAHHIAVPVGMVRRSSVLSPANQLATPLPVLSSPITPETVHAEQTRPEQTRPEQTRPAPTHPAPRN